MHFQTIASILLLSTTTLLGVASALPHPEGDDPEETTQAVIPSPTSDSDNPEETSPTALPSSSPEGGDSEGDDPEQSPQSARPPQCRTCNPISGENHCHPTTSCINTGARFHCACRAGYKASRRNNDINKQFRLPFNNFEFLVFTPGDTECNVLCNDWMQPPPRLCSEVPLYRQCQA